MLCKTCSMKLEKEWHYCPACGQDQRRVNKSFLAIYEEWEERYQSKIVHSTLYL